MMKFLQQLGKALMLPTMCLPLCGLLTGVGFFLCPSPLHENETLTAAPLVGLFLIETGRAILNHIATIFAFGVGMGMAKDQSGTGGLAGLISWLILTTLLAPDVATSFITFAETTDAAPFFASASHPFLGVLAGIIGAFCHNRFHDAKLPEWLTVFTGQRCVFAATGIFSAVLAAALLFLWPMLLHGLTALGQVIAGVGVVSAGIYAFLNRLLIPLGLHHALNHLFWFDTVGLGDLTHFWLGETGENTAWAPGLYMSGFFPCMMFGVPGAALAILHTTKGGRKKTARKMLVSAAVGSFACGITEPFEILFMTAAPKLYAAYAALYGIFTILAAHLGFRAGFTFSAGAVDLALSAPLPAAQNTWLILPLGLAAFVSFYLVFRIMTAGLDLKTLESKEDLPQEKRETGSATKGRAIAEAVFSGVGGQKNLISVDHCITRLRLTVRNSALVDKEKIKAAGVPGVLCPSKESVQVVVGKDVQIVAEELKKLCE